MTSISQCLSKNFFGHDLNTFEGQVNIACGPDLHLMLNKNQSIKKQFVKYFLQYLNQFFFLFVEIQQICVSFKIQQTIIEVRN